MAWAPTHHQTSDLFCLDVCGTPPFPALYRAVKSQPDFPTSAINEKSSITKETQKMHMAVGKHLPAHLLPWEVSISGMAAFWFKIHVSPWESGQCAGTHTAEMSSGTSFTKCSRSGGLGAGEAPHAASQASIQQEWRTASMLTP